MSAVPALVLSEPGIYDLPEEAYHADPCPAPSLSRSVLKQLVYRSAKHAYTMHPRLGAVGDLDAGSDDEVQDAGTAAHAAFLQAKSVIRQLDFPDWRTKKAKEARAQAYSDGEIPLLTPSYGRAMRLIDALEEFRSKTGAFTQGRPEQTIIWQDGPVWCRARVDWVPDNPEAPPWDLKTTGGSAVLGAWSRVAFDKGYDLQDAFYCRGLEFVRGEPPAAMKFAVIEQRPPYAIKVYEMSQITRELADQDVGMGLSIWENCLATGEFPGYPWETEWIDPPPWTVRDRQNRSELTQRTQDLLRGREHPNAVRYIETGNFGG